MNLKIYLTSIPGKIKGGRLQSLKCLSVGMYEIADERLASGRMPHLQLEQNAKKIKKIKSDKSDPFSES